MPLGVKLSTDDAWKFSDQAERATEKRILALDASELPAHHRDPFDCVLVAAVLGSNATILTPDEAIRQYPVSCRW